MDTFELQFLYVKLHAYNLKAVFSSVVFQCSFVVRLQELKSGSAPPLPTPLLFRTNTTYNGLLDTSYCTLFTGAQVVSAIRMRQGKVVWGHPQGGCASGGC